jgi:charged multivesicular body protein 6
MCYKLQEVSEMLANRMSNQDEDEVEDELKALEAEISGRDIDITLPDAPKDRIVLSDEQQEEFRKEMQKERRLKRQQERDAERSSQPVLA